MRLLKEDVPASRAETFPAPSAMLGNVFITWNILHYSRVLRQNSWTPQGRSFDDDTRAQLLRRPGRPALERAGGNQKRAAGIRRLRHVRNGDESSLPRVPGYYRRCRGHASPRHGHSLQLPRPVFARRRHPAVRRHPHEPHAARPLRTRGHGQLREEGLARGRSLRRCPRARLKRGHAFRQDSRARRR